MNRWIGSAGPLGGHAFGAPRRATMLAQPQRRPAPPTGPAARALEEVREAQGRMRSVERSLGRLERAIGPEAALKAYEEAKERLEDTWKNYVEKAEDLG